MKITLFLAFGVVSAYDDHSLMQQKLGIETVHEVSVEAYASAVKEIGNAMQKLPFPGKMRQLALDSLMRELSVSSPGNMTNSELYTEIRQLLADLITEFIRQRDVDDVALSQVVTLLNGCNTAGWANDNATEVAFVAAKNAHSPCRTLECTLLDNASTYCGYMTTEMDYLLGQAQNGPTYLTCDFLPSNVATFTTGTGMVEDIRTKLVDNFQTWSDGFDAVDAWFELTKTRLVPLIQPCTQAMTIYETQRTVCNGLQTVAEVGYCTRKSTRETLCTTLTDCFTNETAIHNALVVTLAATAVQRMNEGELVKHIDCLIGVLELNNTDFSTCDAVPDANYVSTNFNITLPTLPTPVTCSLADVSDTPDQASWVTTHYAGLPASCQATTSTENCAR